MLKSSSVLKNKAQQTIKYVSIVVYWSAFLTGNSILCHNSALFLFCNYTTEFFLLVAIIIDHLDLPTPHTSF